MSFFAFAEPEETSDDWFESLKGNVGLTVGDLTPRYGDDTEEDKSESLEPESIPDGVATIKKDAIDIWLDSLPGAVGKVIGDLNPRFGDSSESKQGETGTASTQDPNDPEIAALIREWIGVAEPPENATDGADLHYNEWGVRLGSVVGGVIKGTPGKPDDVGARTSPEYLWGIRIKLDSVDHCTLEEFVMERLEQHDIKQCAGRYKPLVAHLVGKTKKTAEKLISQRRLKPKVLPGEPAPSKDANGKVQRQEPASGTSLARGQTVTIWIHSPYVDRRTIPDLIGLSPKAAKARLKAADLKPKLRPGDPAPTKAKSGKVQAQTPEPGTRIRPGAEVQLIVYSPYVAIRKLPDLTGLSSKKAKARLAELGLKAKLRPGSPAPDSGKSGKVEVQKPAAGTEVKPGALVELSIHAPYVAQIEVPNLVGLYVEQAYTKLKSTGYLNQERESKPVPWLHSRHILPMRRRVKNA
jgi:beta-lactam-binding protein with PASTA domain